MSYTTPAAIEFLMQDRLADRRHEADQQRLADMATRQHHASTPRHSLRTRSKLALRYLASLV